MRVLACDTDLRTDSIHSPGVGDLVWCGTKPWAVNVDIDARYPGLRALAREPARWKRQAPKQIHNMLGPDRE